MSSAYVDDRGVFTDPPSTSWWQMYRWRMRHYFYLHVLYFILLGLLGGWSVYIIENYLVPNQFMNVRYVDAWFVASSCAYSCGLITIDFARLSHASQVLLMVITLASGITVSTLPALVIKALTHKRESGTRVDDDHSAFHIQCESEKKPRCSPEAEDKIARLPTPEQLRYRAYLACLVLIPTICTSIYLAAYLSIGLRLTSRYRPWQLLQDGQPVNPWYASLIISITGFNQNGLSPWSDNLFRFVDDVVLNLLVMAVVMSGTSFFPIIFRNTIQCVKWFAPWHHQVVFEYILLNNHRLSTVLFPTIQTRIYLTVTFFLYALGIGISLVLDYSSPNFAMFPGGLRLLIFAFQTIIARFAGFQTIDLNRFAAGTLIIYLLLMTVKPQMLCALDKLPFELEWHAIRSGPSFISMEEPKQESPPSSIVSTDSHVFPVRRLHRILRQRSFKARLRAKRYFASLTTLYPMKSQKSTWLKMRLFVLIMSRRLLSHVSTLLSRTYTWLYIFIFLVCCFESSKITPVDDNVTVIKIVFDVVSAFGSVGLTTGYPNVSSSFCTIFTDPSKIVIVLTMLIGRHRGLLDSMKDQEKIEYSAHTLLARWQQMARDAYPTAKPRARYMLERPLSTISLGLTD